MLPGQHDMKSLGQSQKLRDGWQVWRGGRFPQTTDECTKTVVTTSC